ncbi:MAG TPA: 3-mercaptopyruvate sulfurtransferase [Methylocella sp.]|jgi:thiosulfate/3-mercaptopyruvate sulfurtransferase
MTASSQESFFVSTAWLAEHLGAPNVAIIDGTFFLPDENRDAKAEYLAGHIPGAVFFDIDAIADHATNLPHMLPRPAAFAEAMEKLGLGDEMRFVVYDSSNLQGGARVWWTLRVFGARDVKILAGGLPRWRAEKRPLEQGPVRRMPRPFTVEFDSASVAGAEQVQQASAAGSPQVLDARAAARFAGTAAEPRPGLRSGHIPGSFNLPWREVVQLGEIIPESEIKTLMAKVGVDVERPVITTCGSGVTAAILLLALASIGKSDVALYDGSWAEWGARLDLPVARNKC